jgi:hypothetical protein
LVDAQLSDFPSRDSKNDPFWNHPFLYNLKGIYTDIYKSKQL